MLTRLEAFISGMVFLMPGFTTPINTMPEEMPAHWTPTRYVEQLLGSGRDDLKLCANHQNRETTNKPFSVRLPIESGMGEIVHKDWQYFILDSTTASSLNFGGLSTPPEGHRWRITKRYITDHHGPGEHCLNPLQSPWINKPSYVM
ncbi:hypothetical protein QKW35_06930 [Pontibacterium granulatum]|uniref:hypothetical protein n=1 Tax=Pontibacterium granulatum TaxID=2036029 RepID=UPI00249A509F|nr:hypothetical protein [Pontibacterium granulatum]MDI3324107.1 hypothetical protein [Pontibacterium granulatum]